MKLSVNGIPIAEFRSIYNVIEYFQKRIKGSPRIRGNRVVIGYRKYRIDGATDKQTQLVRDWVGSFKGINQVN